METVKQAIICDGISRTFHHGYNSRSKSLQYAMHVALVELKSQHFGFRSGFILF